MHYDEAIHLHYSWRLANLETFIHSPWMHGPFQIELAALFMRILGDTDFTARLAYVIFGSALVGLPYFLRDFMGRTGAFFTAVMLMLSPALLYFSRFGRNDILMAFWAVALFILLWRYIHRSENRYLYLASAVLAFMFATKETAYIITLILGGIAFLLALPDLVPWLFRRVRLSQLTGAAGFFILLFTLTLPQWSSLSGLFQGFFWNGLVLVNPNDVSIGLVGAPHWGEPFVSLPVFSVPWPVHLAVVAIFLGACTWLNWDKGLSRADRISRSVLPVAIVVATFLVLFRPISHALGEGRPWVLIDLPIAGALLLLVLSLWVQRRYPLRVSVPLLIVPPLLVSVYAALFTPLVNVEAVVTSLLPDGIQVDTTTNGIPVNFLVAGAILATALAVSFYLGLLWKARVWLGCAAIYYFVWFTLYTTVYTNWGGMFSGVWQGMGYWIAQQDVARGNQPWYYYFVGLSVYELLPLVFAILGAIYYLRKGDIFGLALILWSGLTLLAYTLASEKMPWLLVGIVLPLIFLAGKYLGDLADRLTWRQILRSRPGALLILIPLLLAGTVYLLRIYLNPAAVFAASEWFILAGLILLAVTAAYLVRLAQAGPGMALVGLGSAALLLALGTWGAFRASYIYDDSNKEILVYAQGSADVRATFDELDQQVFQQGTAHDPVRVDYELWYPMQWYVRQRQEEGDLSFACFKDEKEEGWNAGCNPISEPPEAGALL
ncbi:MAG: glycosyltransferase family 39 protein, partial [Stenotrophomonas maltophilia]